MSKIYRRPMFRGGGPVSSYGNGITAPLVPGYQMGGSINTPRRGLVTQPGGYAGTLAEELAKDGLNNTSAGMGLGDLILGGSLYNNVAPTGQVPAGVVVKETETETETAQPIEDLDFSELDSDFDQTETRIVSDGKGGTKEVQSYVDSTQVTENISPDLKFMFKPGYGYEELKADRNKISTKKIQERVNAEEEGLDILRPGGQDAGGMTVSEIEDLGLSDAEKALQNQTENPEISAKDAIRENQALFKELLGSKKARGQDISDMLLRFSGSDGNTIGEKFKNYTKAESAAGPGRSEKINQTASALAINDYVAGKRSKEQGELLTKKIDYELDAKNKYLTPQEGDSNSQALAKIARANKIDPSSNRAVKQLLKFKLKRSDIYGITTDPMKKNLSKKLRVGINIVTDKGGAKTIFEKKSDGTVTQIPFDGI